MDEGRKEVLDFLSSNYDTEFEFKTIGDLIWEADHYYLVNVTRDYDSYTVKEFLILCQIDCLFAKGEITENDRNCLIRLFYQKKNLADRLGKRKSDDQMLWDKIKKIDEIFAKYNIGDLDLARMIYNNAVLNENVDLNSEITKRKL